MATSSKCLKPPLFIFLILISASVSLTTDLYGASWIGSIGGNGRDFGITLAQTPAGDFFLAGLSEQNDSSFDPWVIRLDEQGDLLWQKRYEMGVNFYVGDFCATEDGGLIAVCTTSTVQIYACAVKIDADGNIQWSKYYKSISPSAKNTTIDIQPRSVFQATDGSYIVAGQMFIDGLHYNAFILKLDSDGNGIWLKSYGSSFDDIFIKTVVPTDDGGYLITGSVPNLTSYYADIFVMKLDQVGTVQWQRAFGGDETDHGRGGLSISDGNYVVVGYTNSLGIGDYDVWILKLDDTGTILWQKTYGSSQFDMGTAINETIDGGYTISGYTVSASGDSDFMLMHLNQDGSIQWQKGYSLPGEDYLISHQQIGQGDYLVAGRHISSSTAEDFLHLKTDQNGEIHDCDLVQNLGLIEQQTNVTAQQTTMGETNLLVINLDLTVPSQNTNEVQELHCYSDSGVPTLGTTGILLLLLSFGLLLFYNNFKMYTKRGT